MPLFGGKDTRLRWVMGVVSLAIGVLFIAVFVRLIQYQFIEETRITRDWKRKLEGSRGRILDRNGTPLAESIPGRLVFIDPQAPPVLKLTPAQTNALTFALSELLEVEEDHLIEAYNHPKNRFIPVKTIANETLISNLQAQISQRKMPGVGLNEKTIRSYPHGRRLSHVLGFINSEGVGSAGVELKYDRYLRGTPGYIEGARDAHRKEIRTRRTGDMPPVPGANIHLTIDNNIQFITERALAEAMTTNNATAAIAIVQRVRTGEILAMASLPNFDPSAYQADGTNTWLNSAIGKVYEPGSVMKSIAVAAALNERLITPDTTFDVKQGVWFYGGKPLRDHVYGIIDTRLVLAKSSNIASAQIGLMLSEPYPKLACKKNQLFERYLRAFGFGSTLGFCLNGEERGILPPASSWSVLSPTRIAIGQGIAVTALQMLNTYCTIANGGYLMRPYIIERIEGQDGNVILKREPEVIGRPIRKEVAACVSGMLRTVTEAGGTARRAAVEGYTVAGKTGTAQIPGIGGYSQTDYNATFVGFFPATAPEIGIIVTFERPQPKHTGGVVAAPVFAAIAKEIARYLAIPPDKTD